VPIRIADPTNAADRATIIRLNQDFAVVSDVTLSDDHAAGLDLLLQDAPNLFTFLVEDDAGRGIGYAMCQVAISSFLPGRTVNLHDIYIEESERSRGLGRRVFEEILDEARRRGCGKITLEVMRTNVRAQKLYRALGFGDGVPDGDGGSTWYWSMKVD